MIILVTVTSGCSKEIIKEIHVKDGTTIPTEYISGEEAINLFVSTIDYQDFKENHYIVRIDAIYAENQKEMEFALKDVWVLFAVEKNDLKLRMVIDANTSQIYSSRIFRVE